MSLQTTPLEQFKNEIRCRNGFEWGAIALLIPGFIYQASVAETLWSRWMNLELALAFAFIGLHIFYHSHLRSGPHTGQRTESQTLYRQELERQAQQLARMPYWYLAPIFIGWSGLVGEKIWLAGPTDTWPWTHLVHLVLLIAVMGFLMWYNQVKVLGQLRQKLAQLAQEDGSTNSK